jgi:hypothetical protein
MTEVDPKTKRNAMRMLAVAYDMSGGKAGIPLDRGQLFQRVKEMAIFDWTDKQFAEWKSNIIAKHKGPSS